jgi:hypothetical protein
MAKGKGSVKAKKIAAKAKKAVIKPNDSAVKKTKKSRRKESYSIYVFKVIARVLFTKKKIK